MSSTARTASARRLQMVSILTSLQTNDERQSATEALGRALRAGLERRPSYLALQAASSTAGPSITGRVSGQTSRMYSGATSGTGARAGRGGPGRVAGSGAGGPRSGSRATSADAERKAVRRVRQVRPVPVERDPPYEDHGDTTLDADDYMQMHASTRQRGLSNVTSEAENVSGFESWFTFWHRCSPSLRSHCFPAGAAVL